MSDDSTYKSLLLQTLSYGAQFLLTAASAIAVAHLVAKSLDTPSNTGGTSSNEKLTIAKIEWNKKYGTPFPELSSYEMALLQDMIFPSEIDVSFDQIGGMENIKNDLFETVLFPLSNPQFFSSGASGHPATSLLSLVPTGVLLYGPPGCGKTLLAKAIAKQGDITFLNCNFANLISKYYGESEKYVSALFSLARKCSPAIIWIDEVDVYLGKRQSGSKEQESRLIAQFLALWDGLTSSNQGSIIVLGATNRPHDLDEAILRRFSSQILFDLPTAQERAHILSILLASTVVEDYDQVLQFVAENTAGYSGSDLKEVCKRAAMQAVRAHISSISQQQQRLSSSQGPQASSTYDLAQAAQRNQIKPRKTTRDDFILALGEIQPSGQKAMQYLRSFYTTTGVPTRFLGQPQNITPKQQGTATSTINSTSQPSVQFNLAGGAQKKAKSTKKVQKQPPQAIVGISKNHSDQGLLSSHTDSALKPSQEEDESYHEISE